MVMPTVSQIIGLIFIAVVVWISALVFGCRTPKKNPCPGCPFNDGYDWCRHFCDTRERYLRRLVREQSKRADRAPGLLAPEKTQRGGRLLHLRSEGADPAHGRRG